MALSRCKPILSDNPINTLLNSKFTNYGRDGYVEVGEEKACVPRYYQRFEQEIEDFEVRNDDMFLCGFPKTGTTWASEMVWLIANDLNYEEAAKQDIGRRFIQMDGICQFDYEKIGGELSSEILGMFDFLKSLQTTRFIKLHFHWSLLPKEIRDATKKPKIVVILRAPEDVCVSYYHYARGMTAYSGTFSEFAELFLAGRVNLGPYWTHVKSFWRQKDRSNILFVKYTDMKNDMAGVIKRVSNFLDKSYTDEQIEKLVEHLSFDKIKQNSSVNGTVAKEWLQAVHGEQNLNFIRKGQVGGYKSEMSPELIERFKKWRREYLDIENSFFE